MGLDTSHGAWHGAYSAFSRWRNAMAEAAGYVLWTVQYDNGFLAPTIMIDWGHIPDGALEGEWPEAPSDPMLYLIAHSDCEGTLSPDACAALADRLEGLLPLLPDEDAGGHIGNWREKTSQFIAGCRAAATANEPLDFH